MPEALFSPTGSSPGALPSRHRGRPGSDQARGPRRRAQDRARPLVETDLAAELGVSKTPVREALKTLAGTGLVTMSPYKGATVREIERAHAPAHIRHAPPAGARGRGAGRSVAVHRDWVAGARGPGGAPTSSADAAGRSLANRAFHRHMYARLRQPAAGAHPGRPARPDRAGVGGGTGRSWPVEWEREAAEHRAILAAAERGDTEEVRDLMRSHISSFVARTFPEDET